MPALVRARHNSDKMLKYYSKLVPDPRDQASTWLHEWELAKASNDILSTAQPDLSRLEKWLKSATGEGSAFGELIYIAATLLSATREGERP
jgi:hypothetical protein